VGKYDKVIETLPKLPIDPTPYQERVELAKAEFAEQRTSAARTEKYVEIRREKDRLEDIMSVINLRLEAITQLLVEAYESEDLQTIKLGDGASVSVQLEPYVGVVNKEAFRQWCLAQHLEREMHLHPSTATALMKERLLSGESMPCDQCEGTGVSGTVELEAGATVDVECPVCRGQGSVVAPGVRIFAKAKPVLRGMHS